MKKKKIICPLTLVNVNMIDVSECRGGRSEESCGIWDEERKCCALLTFLKDLRKQ